MNPNSSRCPQKRSSWKKSSGAIWATRCCCRQTWSARFRFSSLRSSNYWTAKKNAFHRHRINFSNPNSNMMMSRHFNFGHKKSKAKLPLAILKVSKVKAIISTFPTCCPGSAFFTRRHIVKTPRVCLSARWTCFCCKTIRPW